MTSGPHTLIVVFLKQIGSACSILPARLTSAVWECYYSLCLSCIPVHGVPVPASYFPNRKLQPRLLPNHLYYNSVVESTQAMHVSQDMFFLPLVFTGPQCCGLHTDMNLKSFFDFVQWNSLDINLNIQCVGVLKLTWCVFTTNCSSSGGESGQNRSGFKVQFWKVKNIFRKNTLCVVESK